MKIHFFPFIFIFAFLPGCSSQPTSIIEVSSDGTATISQDNIAVSIRRQETEQGAAVDADKLRH